MVPVVYRYLSESANIQSAGILRRLLLDQHCRALNLDGLLNVTALQLYTNAGWSARVCGQIEILYGRSLIARILDIHAIRARRQAGNGECAVGSGEHSLRSADGDRCDRDRRVRNWRTRRVVNRTR